MSHPDTIFKHLFDKGKRLLYNRGDTILRAGDTPSGVYLLVSGWVKVYSLCEDGELNILTNLSDYDIFPLDWAVTGSLRDVSFAALEPTQVLRIPRDRFLGACNNPAIARAVTCKLADYVGHLSSELENLHYRSARERVAFRLLCLASNFGETTKDDHIVINIQVSNEYIARSTNMTRETASREISRLANKQLIQHANGYIIIKDLEALQQQVSKNFQWSNNGVKTPRKALKLS